MDMVVRVSEGSEARGERRGHRMAGWAAIVASGAFLVQPLSVALLPFDLEAVHDPVELSRYWWAGTLQALEFTVIGAAVLTLVVAVRELGARSVAGQVSCLLGCVSGAAFLLQATLSAATYSSWLMRDASTFVPDAGIRSAILFSTFVAGYAVLGLANLSTAGWLLGFVRWGRPAGLVGAVLTTVLLLVAVLLVLGTVSGVTIPTVLLHVPMWWAVGIALLRARPREAAAPR